MRSKSKRVVVSQRDEEEEDGASRKQAAMPSTDGGRRSGTTTTSVKPWQLGVFVVCVCAVGGTLYSRQQPRTAVQDPPAEVRSDPTLRGGARFVRKETVAPPPPPPPPSLPAPLPAVCPTEVWLAGLAKPCGAELDASVMADTCCAFREAQPEQRRGGVPGFVPGAEARLPVAARPLWGYEHSARSNAVFGLAFGYDVDSYKIFAGSLRKAGFVGDVVLSTSPERKMGRGVAAYLQSQRVLAYPFEFTCLTKATGRRRLLATPVGCVLDDWYAGGDRRRPRPLALARYEQYETWAREYAEDSLILVLDTRDAFFQADPFLDLEVPRGGGIGIGIGGGGGIGGDDMMKTLWVFQENHIVKTVGNCPFNSGWLSCFDKPPDVTIVDWRGIVDRPTALVRRHAEDPVHCSGSTLGSRRAMLAYFDAMVEAFDEFACHESPFDAIQSDQGYHNFLILSGRLRDQRGLDVVSESQGHGAVNTIGAMNGGDVPRSLVGPLDTKWGARHEVDGYIFNKGNEQQPRVRSPVVHQWDRWAEELMPWLKRAFIKDDFVPGARDLYKRFPPLEDTTGCTDRPWRNGFGMTCDELRPHHRDWASKQGVPAIEACCIFGGGVRQAAQPPDAASSKRDSEGPPQEQGASAKEEDHDEVLR